jgi:hypothetical protein
MIDYVDEIVAAYDKVLSKLDDGFNAVRRVTQQGQVQLLMIYSL